MEIDEYLSGDELKSPDKQNDSMIANLTIINLFLELYTKKVESISSQAYRYDFDETTRANGYRTQVKIFAKILNDIQLTFSRYKINSQSLFMETSSSKSRIKSWKEFLIAYYPIICTVAKLMEVFPNQLIADKEDIFNKFILEHYASYSHPSLLWKTLRISVQHQI
ncbi:hypothetical protein RF11_11201 [Thelohanellus kitauei]|uniref:Hormone-sensitive lipase N-terminal domain-containing protein n=1 Tax=Thelohanellus kitauei TaxID=669202 RepID=A0A0C2MZW3_THEKT|nr:hypothetical protein RF11_11201 [Thelohanellus kitauei]